MSKRRPTGRFSEEQLPTDQVECTGNYSKENASSGSGLLLDVQLNDITQVLALPGGGALLVDKTGDYTEEVIRVDGNGSPVQTYYTCRKIISGFIQMSAEEVLVIQRDGLISHLTLTHGATKHIQLNASDLRPGARLDQDNVLLVEYDRGEVFRCRLSAVKYEVERTFIGCYGHADQHKVMVSGLDGPSCVAHTTADCGDSYAVCEYRANKVRIYDSTWKLKKTIGGWWSPADAKLYLPNAATFLQSSLLVADCQHCRVAEFSLDGCFIRDLLQVKDGIKEPRSLSYQQHRLWLVDAYWNGKRHGHLKCFALK